MRRAPYRGAMRVAGFGGRVRLDSAPIVVT
jgi:hypothetical protein